MSATQQAFVAIFFMGALLRAFALLGKLHAERTAAVVFSISCQNGSTARSVMLRFSSSPPRIKALSPLLRDMSCFIRYLGGMERAIAVLVAAMPSAVTVLAGTVLGIMVMGLVWMFRSACSIIIEPVLAWSRTSPQIFYPAFFFLTAELAQLFKDTRWLAESLWHIARPLLRTMTG